MPDPAGKSQKSAIVLVGESPAFQAVLQQIEAVARLAIHVLLTGETGTGKSLVAQYIHQESGRTGDFVEVSLPNVPEHLAESELFGHERGAFTGSVGDRIGLVREADRGTLFLDEIGDLSPTLQAKLLAVTEKRQVRPVGGKVAVAHDTRFVSATHQALDAMVAQGGFRADLYHRLAVFVIHLPPLRERGDDVILIARVQLTSDPMLAHVPRPRISRSGERFLRSYTWPGNLRELRNVLCRAAILSRGRELDEDRLRDALTPTGQSPAIAIRPELRLALPEPPPPPATTSSAKRPAQPAAKLPTLSDLVALAEEVHEAGGRVLKLALDRGRIRRADVVSRIGLAERTADRVLAGLVEAGVLEKDGRKGNAGGYVVVRRAA